MAEGIPPREASDRLSIYQARFEELWRKYETYSGGEELFGLEVTNYTELQKIKKVSEQKIPLKFTELKLMKLKH